MGGLEVGLEGRLMKKRKSSEWEGVEIELEVAGGSEGVD